MKFSIQKAANQKDWDNFLTSQEYCPFLQSWTMGEVYKEIGQEAIRLQIMCDGRMVGLCFGHIVSARRGKHISIPYGPVLKKNDARTMEQSMIALCRELTMVARKHQCSFIRISPFWPLSSHHAITCDKWLQKKQITPSLKLLQAPLHLLAEYLWIIRLTGQTEESLLKNMRKTTRNLIRRAEKEGVIIRKSERPNDDIEHFLRLHEETRLRHGFTPYTHEFFRTQVRLCSEKNACSLYTATYREEVIAASIHMHAGGETSYHHGASTHKFTKIPASTLLQWQAIKDALQRGDRLYNFWGIAPHGQQAIDWNTQAKKNRHPFAGVTLFKTGFGGESLSLVHCMDIPLTPWYTVTRILEQIRKKKRGF